jgi:hypothetical protein
MKDYYQVLGVLPTANGVEIKRAYRKLALLYHPDKNPAPSAEQFFKEVNEAYDVIGDEVKRRQYDQRRHSAYVNINVYENTEPRHRDPAYKRRPPSTAQRKPSQLQLMKQYLPYVKWLTWLGVAIILALAADYYLPVVTSKETVYELNFVSGNRGDSFAKSILVTTNHKITLYGHDADYFYVGTNVDVEHTLFLKIVRKVTRTDDYEQYVLIQGIYGPMIIFPIMLAAISFLGVLFRNNVEYSFNLSIGSGLLILLLLYLMWAI